MDKVVDGVACFLIVFFTVAIPSALVWDRVIVYDAVDARMICADLDTPGPECVDRVKGLYRP